MTTPLHALIHFDNDISPDEFEHKKHLVEEELKRHPLFGLRVEVIEM